jgi:hypothetical protein
MRFLRKRRIEATDRFWAALEADQGDAPAALAELARGDSSVVCGEREANVALASASQHPEWVEAPAPVYMAGP